MMRTVWGLSFLYLVFFSSLLWGSIFVLPQQGNQVGKIYSVRSLAGETLAEVGLRYDMGWQEMVKANPGLDPQQPLALGTVILIPAVFSLPRPWADLTINLAEYRLYYFPPGENIVITMPVGIGKKGWETPLGHSYILSKERDPIWHPSPRLQAEGHRRGSMIPDYFPGGLGNPLGRHALRLGWSEYLIHGSNQREGIGKRSSAGCIRLLAEDIEYLFEKVPIKTKVHIINSAEKQKNKKEF